MIFDAYRAWRDVVDELRRVAGLGARSPDARPVVALRWATEPDSARAKTASAMPVTGTPRSSADLHGPAAGALLLGLVEDDVDERLAGLGVVLAQHLGGDLDQEAVQVALVPVGEDVGDLGRALARAPSRSRW